MRHIRIAMGQINPVVGEFDGNLRKIISYTREAQNKHADIVIFPELSLCGYPPEDLLLLAEFGNANKRTLAQLTEITSEFDTIVVVGFAEKAENDGKLYNAAAVIHKGKIIGIYRKHLLPNYGVFDEKRYFSTGEHIPIFVAENYRFGIGICEDIWHPDGPTAIQSSVGKCELVLNLNASPFHRGKRELREQMVIKRARDNAVAVIYLNCVGGQDELVFDGQSFIVDATGEIIVRGAPFEEELLIADVDLDDVVRARLQPPNINDNIAPLSSEKVKFIHLNTALRTKEKALRPIKTPPDEMEEMYLALKTGIRDYVHKNGFKSAIIGLSGGIDSALVAAIAADALGSQNVHTIFMPTRYSSEESRVDAEAVARNLGTPYKSIPIDDLFERYLAELAPYFKGYPPDITEENLQARIRGNILMALSNKFGHLVIATGNKSEMAVGYATLYGDMVGGFALIKDVPKTTVYELARWINREHEIIPRNVIEKTPTAELRANQKDTDSLPPYDMLDSILTQYIEEELSLAEIAERTGYERSIIDRVAKMVDRAEYKRRQAPPGIKITPRAFGKERRMPITNHFKRWER